MLGQSLKNYFRRASLAQKLVDDAESINQDSETGSVREFPSTEIEINEEKDDDIQIPTTDYESSVGRKEGQALNVKMMAKMFTEKGIAQNILQPAQNILQPATVICQETTKAKPEEEVKARPLQRSESMTSSCVSVIERVESPNLFPEKVQLPTKIQVQEDKEIKGTQEDIKKRKRRRHKRTNKKCKESDTESCESDDFKNGNWMLQQNNEKKDNYIKITMEDLKELISGGKGTQLKNTASKHDMEMKLRRLESVDYDCTDTETLNSGLSFSSGNSQDALLPMHKRTSSLHLVNPARVGILKRFLPSINVEESQSSDSVQTGDTYLYDMPATPRVNYPEKRRKSLQPEMLRYYDNCHSSLHMYTDMLKGTSRRHRYQNKEFYDSSFRRPSMNPMKPSRYGVSFEDEHFNYDGELEDEFDCHPYSGYQPMKTRKPMMVPNRRLSVQPDGVWNTPMSMPMNSDPQIGFTQPSQIVQQVPVPVLVNQQPAVSPAIPNVPVAVPSSTVQPPQNNDILQQLQNVLDTGALDSQANDSSQSQSEDTRKEDNSLEAHLNRVREMMAERKKRSEENKPFLIAKILTIIANTLLLFCSGGVAGIGILYMVKEDSAIYTGVTQSDSSDQNFQFFCYTLCLVGGLVLGILVCGFCGSIKAKQACLKLFMIAVGVALTIEIGLVVFLYMVNSTSVPVFSLISSAIETNLIKQLREIIIHQYMEGSVAATAWDNIQVMAECCGCLGADDYKLSSWKNATTTDKKQGVPNSCCVLKEKTLSDPEPTNKLLCHTMVSGFWHKRGCIEVLREWYHNLSMMTLAATGGLFIIEIICIIFALRLFMKTKQKKEREEKRRKEALEKDKREK
ncbi:uncharacterized protein LOC134282920 [Saccostrea cucullata]|uniref:uncharacterized protein LOC134282920 n=1 Tax=Saccostrea cuccullata TaxID=36930 RepID=UPI002ED1AC01